jgi:mono/diheme cytochrome c family protein
MPTTLITRAMLICGLGVVAAAGLTAQTGSNWTIPSSAQQEKSPLKPNAALLKKGRGLFESRCVKCHGAAGLGDGREADPENKPANLTASRADQNPDGVLFYKVWNGQPPKMPAFKSQMSRDEVWTVVEYVKTLRRTQ